MRTYKRKTSRAPVNRIDGSVRDRLFARLVHDPATGCLLWTGTLNHDGYGVIRADEKIRKVHRVMWEMHEGPIPAGMTIDHVYDRGCRHRNCANLAHLEPVPFVVNLRRGVFHNGNKTHCKRGHPFDEANTALSPQGVRRCRTCVRLGHKAHDLGLTLRDYLERAEAERHKAGTGASTDKRVTRSAS